MSDQFEVGLHDLQVTRYVSIGMLGLVLYDHLLTFGEEVVLIWPAKFGLVKAIFLFNRYFIPLWIAFTLTVLSGLSTYLNSSICQIWAVTTAYTELVTVQTISFIVAARVYDLWQSQRVVFFLLGPFWLAHCAIDIFIMTSRVLAQYETLTYFPALKICYGSAGQSWILWLNSIIYHALILLILLYIWLSTPRTKQTPLMKLVVRDGLLYFATIFGGMLFNLLVWRYSRQSLLGIPYISVWCLMLIALSRMLLSMGSVQTPEEWGQRAKISVPSSARDLEMDDLLLEQKQQVWRD